MAGESVPSIYESVLKRKDGSRFFAELNAGIISYEGKPADLIIVRDINERKKIQDTLSKSERLYRTLAEASSDLIFVIDRNDRVEYVNSYAAAIMNKTVSEIIGSPRSILFSPELDKNQKKALETVFETGTSIRHEGPLTIAGQTHWFDHVLLPLRDADNRIISVLGISRDITARRRMEEELHESERKYRTLVERANDVICIIQDGIVKMCNPRMLEYWGGSMGEIIGKNISDFVHPDCLPTVIKRYKQRIAGENPPSIYETIFIRKDGSKSFVELNAGIVSYEGRPADLIIVRDINERKRAESALRDSEATARALINAPTDSVLLIDDQGMILALNDIAASRFGKRGDELVGTMSYDLLPKEIAQSRRSLMAPVLEKKEMVRFMDERAGRWYDTVAYPILNETGEVKKIAIIARDITEQKTFETQLLESEQMYKRLLEQTFDATIVHKEGKITFLNERAMHLLGASSPLDLIGRSIRDFIHPDSLQDIENRLQKLSANHGMPVPVLKEKFFRLDGTTITAEVMAISFFENGIPAVRVVLREISPP
jgi:PAS domain S-box-containing protein